MKSHGLQPIRCIPKIRFSWRTRQPMPIDPQWDPPLAKQFAEQFNPLRLVVKNGSQERYTLFEEDHKLGEVRRKDLEDGIDLMRFPDLSLNHSGGELLRLVQQRERLLSLAWLTDVGHKRPGTAIGLPLDQAQQQAAELETQIRRLAQPATLNLRLVPVEK